MVYCTFYVPLEKILFIMVCVFFLMSKRVLDLKNKCNVLVIGSGAREHCLVWALERSKYTENVYVAPGNAGTAPKNCSVDLADYDAVLQFCKQLNIKLVVIGSEELLSKGMANYLLDQDIAVFGPSKEAALIETDKAYARKICENLGIPSPQSKIFSNINSVSSYLETCQDTIVLKDSFLCKGKGVIVDNNKNNILSFAQQIFAKNRPNQTVVIEEFLSGVEVSAFVLCDGHNTLYLGDAQDYKRAGNGDTGDLTGGMGAISPSPVMNEELRSEVMSKFAAPIVKYLAECGTQFKGVIFFGLMLTKNGLKLLEFNARFGDPEAQALLPRLDCDIMPLFAAINSGTLDQCGISISSQHSVCIVMATKGYPGEYEKGSNLVIPYHTESALLFQANTTRTDDGQIAAMGGRTLSVVALGNSTQQARKLAYQVVKKVQWSKGYYRNDIGTLTLIQN